MTRELLTIRLVDKTNNNVKQIIGCLINIAIDSTYLYGTAKIKRETSRGYASLDLVKFNDRRCWKVCRPTSEFEFCDGERTLDLVEKTITEFIELIHYML
jgi:hypothetical protein